MRGHCNMAAFKMETKLKGGSVYFLECNYNSSCAKWANLPSQVTISVPICLQNGNSALSCAGCEVFVAAALLCT